MKGGSIEERLNDIIKEIGKITGDIRRIKEDVRNVATKEDIDRIKGRIDELEDNFRRENRKLRDRISELEDNYGSIVRGAKVAQRLGSILRPPVTFAEDSTICDEYKITTYRERTGF